MIKLKKIKVKERENKGMVELDDYMSYYHPTFAANAKQIPEIKDWKVGEKYTVVMEIEMKSMSSRDNDSGKSTDASFNVIAYSVVGEDLDDVSDEDLEELQAKAMSS